MTTGIGTRTAATWRGLPRRESRNLPPRQKQNTPLGKPGGVFWKMGFAGLAGALHEEGALADALAEVMKLGAADFATVGHFDLRDPRGVQREHALHAFAVGNLAHGESGVHAGAAAGDHDAGEDLDPLLVAFLHAAMDLNAVTDVELGDILLQLL